MGYTLEVLNHELHHTMVAMRRRPVEWRVPFVVALVEGGLVPDEGEG